MADHATVKTIINAPPAQCFAVALDYERYPDWAADIKTAVVLTRDDDGRGGEVSYRAAAMGRSTSYTLRYNYGSNPLRISWRLMNGDVMRRLDGEYEFAPVEGDPNSCEVTYVLTVDLAVPLPSFVKRRAEAKIMHTALDDLRRRVETLLTA
ncbi:MAG: SRPBCC family protein [Acidimicrobiales bacterium]|nr:SRPBCC family protein [Acidimicrobiales bacterium]